MDKLSGTSQKSKKMSQNNVEILKDMVRELTVCDYVEQYNDLWQSTDICPG